MPGRRAFEEVGIAVESWRIHRSIGMDGDRLIQSLAGDADEDAQQRADESAHCSTSRSLRRCCDAFPVRGNSWNGCRSLGLQVVLASSASEEELSMSREVLDCDDLISAATSSKDVEVAKPDPTIIEVAMERAGVDADHAVYVGDAVWDIVACGTRRRARRSGFSVAEYHAKNSKTPAQKPFSTIRVTCAITSTAPIASRCVRRRSASEVSRRRAAA